MYKSQHLLQAISRSHNPQGLEMLTAELAELTKRGAIHCYSIHLFRWLINFTTLISAGINLTDLNFWLIRRTRNDLTRGLEEFVATCLICWRQSSQLFEKSSLTVWRWSFLIAPTPMVCCQVTEEKRSANKVELRRRRSSKRVTRYRVTHMMLLFLYCFSTLEHQNCGCFMILW